MPTEIQSLNLCALQADGAGGFNLGTVVIDPVGPKVPCPLDCCPTNGLE